MTNQQFHFSSNLLSQAEEYLSWEVTADQFNIVQGRCSGRPIPASWEGAQGWAQERSEFLQGLALEYQKEAGYYGQPNSYCTYHADDQVIIHMTTSGTLFHVYKDGSLGVSLPAERSGGSHHREILLTLAGVSEADRDRWEKMYLLPRDTPSDVLETLQSEMKAAYDPVLVPHGYQPQITYAEILKARAEREERNKKRVEAYRIECAERGLSPDEEYEDYEDEEYEDEE